MVKPQPAGWPGTPDTVSARPVTLPRPDCDRPRMVWRHRRISAARFSGPGAFGSWQLGMRPLVAHCEFGLGVPTRRAW